MIQKILNRFNGKVIFEIEADSFSAAIKIAIGKNANLSSADLRSADLRSASLRSADLRSANLSFANLSSANLSSANLSSANLSFANLSSANLSSANLSSADLSSADLRECPVKIENIHQKIYESASQPNALDMSQWHCGTAHCRAGWAVELAGEGGKALEYAMGTSAAASLIYISSDPLIEKIPDFHATNNEALEDMKKLAEQESQRGESA